MLTKLHLFDQNYSKKSEILLQFKNLISVVICDPGAQKQS